jgi:hypothetical protein
MSSIQYRMILLALPRDVDVFLAEMRAAPQFKAAAAQNPRLAAHVEAIETGLRELYRAGDDDGNMLELFDEVRHIVKVTHTIDDRCAP